MGIKGLSRGLWAILFTVAVAGCGGEDDAGSSTSRAVSQCENFAEVWCYQAMNCLLTLGTLTDDDYQANFDTCVRVAIATVPCESAVAVTSDYDTCITGIQSMSCSSWDVPNDQLGTVLPPSSCEGVILIE